MSHDLLHRVHGALQALAMLSEARTAKLEKDKISTGKAGSGDVQPVDTELDYFESRLEKWCRDAEERVRRQRKGQADESGQLPKLQGDSKAFWLIHEYEGVEYRDAAARTGYPPQRVRELRVAADREANYGRVRQRAPKAA